MNAKERGYFWAFLGLVMLAALMLRIPQIVERMAFQDFKCADKIAKEARKHMVHVQTDRVIASISAVNNGDRVGRMR
jgi:hypothetical protein